MAKLISDAYQKLNYELHKSDPRYGTKAAKHAPAIADFVVKSGAKSLLDYGCGKGTLKKAIRQLLPDLIVREYDPAIPGKRQLPKPSDLVACLDVMEHIEPEHLDEVLGDIRKVASKYAILTVATEPAKKMLADGRNAHLIVQPKEWWQPRLQQHFEIVSIDNLQVHWFFAVLRPLKT